MSRAQAVKPSRLSGVVTMTREDFADAIRSAWRTGMNDSLSGLPKASQERVIGETIRLRIENIDRRQAAAVWKAYLDGYAS